ncbi:helix-turn-helix domain-containing protein [Streptomyces sp. NRRL B-24484]|uniref:helix-turn-helix domain-containing protein n=1 Tax=Streptomyces sp. NRRL B-24484 TaxID=1463833 RepID=UPI0004C18922|nr:helix-turn-helix transcriptional regulator [Streptomyces sp. NRRL B-24484]
MADNQELGNRIRQLRRAAKLSQADLAGDDLSPSYVSLLEAGKRVPTTKVVEQLAERLGCDPKALLGLMPRARTEDIEVELRYAEIMLRNGDSEGALRAYEKVSAEASDAGQDDIAAQAELGTAQALELCGRLEEAVVRYERLHAGGRPARQGAGRLTVVVALCRCYRELGDLAHAVDLAETTLNEVQRLGLLPTVTGMELLSTLVGLHSERGDLHRASYLASLGLEQARQVEDPKALGAVYWNASLAAHRSGDSENALMLVQRALAIYAEGENERAVARLRNAYATVLLQRDEPDVEAARDLLRRSADTLVREGSSIDLAYCETAMARAELLAGDPAAAAEHARRALELLGPGHRLETARTLLVLAAALQEQGDEAGARESCERGALMLEASGADRQAAFAWAELAEILDRAGESERAVHAYQQGMRCLGRRGSLLPHRPGPARRR